jgi:hypothetical protein
MTCWYKQSAPDAKWGKGTLTTEPPGSRFWVIASDKGKEVARLSNVTLAIRDELLTLEGFAELPNGQFEAQRWTVAFDKAQAK